MAHDTIFEKRLETPSRRIPLQWMIALPLLALVIGGFWIYLARTPLVPRTATGEAAYVPPEGLQRAGAKDFDWYSQFLRIEDVKGSIVFNFAGDRVVMISGFFNNLGERGVEAAEIKITFFDPQEKIIKERVAAPLRPETGLKLPLKSLEKRTFSVRFENMPVDLQVGKLEVVLTGLKLAPRTR